MFVCARVCVRVCMVGFAHVYKDSLSPVRQSVIMSAAQHPLAHVVAAKNRVLFP